MTKSIWGFKELLAKKFGKSKKRMKKGHWDMYNFFKSDNTIFK